MQTNDTSNNKSTNNNSSKDELLGELRKTWDMFPDFKFGYLIGYIVRNGKLQLEISDEDFIKKLKEFNEPLP